MEIDRRSLAGIVAVGLFGPSAAVGQPAPPFSLTTLDKRTFTSTELSGQVVVLNYWATWCAPCRIEMPMMDAYLRRHPGQELRIFAIGTEDSIPATELAPLASAFSFSLVTRFSGRGYGVKSGVPTNYVIDRGGVVRHAESGAFTAAGFDGLIQPLLAAPRLGVRTT